MDDHAQGAVRMRLPILLRGHTLERGPVLPVSAMPIKRTADALTTATLTLAPGAPQVDIMDWVLVTTPQGEEIVMQVQSVVSNPAQDGGVIVGAEHVFGSLKTEVHGAINEDQADLSAADALRALLAGQSETIWVLGRCEFDDALPWKFGRGKIYGDLSAVTDCLQDSQWELDTSAMPFVAHLVRRPTQPECEMRLARNMSSIRVRRELGGMFTRLYPIGMDELTIAEANGGVEYIEENAERRGVIAETLVNAAIDDARVLKAWGRAQLHKNCEPLVEINITGRELSARTGLEIDRLTAGTVCRAAVRGGTICARITELSWQDALGAPESVEVTLASEHRTVGSVVRRMKSEIAEAKRGSGGSGAKQQKTNENMWTRITQTEAEIALEAYRLDQRIDGNVANIARLTITADQIESTVAKYGYDTAGDLLESYYSQITQNADNILLRVAYTDYNGETIASKINIGTNNVLIQSQRIDLEGYVTASRLSAEFASLKSSIANSLYVAALSASGFECSTFAYKGYGMSLKSKDVVVSVGGKSTGEIAVRGADGSIVGTALTGYRVSYSTDTLYYMSWE